MPALQFSPTAWAKLLFLREAGDSEIGGFGIAADDDSAYVEDIKLPRQCCTAVSVIFDDAAVADFFDEQVDLGLRPDQFARIWLHTHPGDCPLPSWLDEQTFERVFKQPDWAIMFILAGNENTYARVRYNTGPGVEVVLPVRVDHTRPFPASDFAAWRDEYVANVTLLPSARDDTLLQDTPFGQTDDSMAWDLGREDLFDGPDRRHTESLCETRGPDSSG